MFLFKIVSGDEEYITWLDINRMRAQGTASVTYTPPPDIGTIDNVFDGYSNTLFRTGIGTEINPVIITVTFTQLQTVNKMVALFSHQGGTNPYRWMVEKADTLADMDGKTGTWAEIVPWTFAQDGVPSQKVFATPITAKLYRLTGQRLLGDNHVHLNEWEFHVPVMLTTLTVRPSSNSVYLGKTARYYCDAYDSAGLRYDFSDKVTWSSLNSAIGNIHPTTGICTGLAVGSTSIRAAYNTLQSAYVPFEVLPARIPNAKAYGLDTLIQWRDLPILKTGCEAGMASSYNRAFNIYATHDDYNRYDSHPNGLSTNVDPVTIREIIGRGVVTRSWMPWQPGPEFKLKLHFDGETTPRLSTNTLEWYDTGVPNHPAINEPFVGIGTGGAWSYMPLFFRNRLKITSNNRSGYLNFYQFNYLLLPGDADVVTYTATQTSSQSADWNLAAEIMNAVGNNPGTSGSQVITSSGNIPIGGTMQLANITSQSGIITRLQIKINSPTDTILAGLILKVFYDGNTTPFIDIPIGEFFGAGRGRIAYKGIMLGTDNTNGYYCYLPMPFRRSVRIILQNDSGVMVFIASAQVEYEPCEVSKEHAYLRALYRSEQFNAGEDKMFEVLRLPKGAGHYLGCLFTITPAQNQLGYLEGNDRITVDGGAKQTLYGTGLEDAFNGGYYYGNTYSGPFSGLLKKTNGITCQYRHMVMDYIPFEQSILVEFQGVDYWGIEYARLYESTAYWYQKAPGPPRLQIFFNGSNTYYLVWDEAGSYDLQFDTSLSFDNPQSIDVTNLTQYSYATDGEILFFRLKSKE